MNNFEQLVLDIKEALGPSAGLTSEEVEVQEITHIMERYVSDKNEWSMYAMADEKIPYTRNLVDEGNGNANLLVLVWTPGKASPIHDHGKAHCLMKILRGGLTETRYDTPVDSDDEKPMPIKSERTLKENAVAYMADELGLHRMSNQGSDFAVSLHLYTPPYVAKNGCHVFNVKTGEKTHVPKCGMYSQYGKRVQT
ncbi:hypothetical protein M426DRAFT_72818 [Hypoxylon sp. CI-4A]|nr:hypothetical protein M426DRAFT_72818 [Hypoxylon sp. CI-4A]